MHERLLIAKRSARIVEDLDAIINDEAENELRDADGMVIRVTRNVWDAVGPYLGTGQTPPSWIAGIRRRLPEKTVYLVRDGADLCKDVMSHEGALRSSDSNLRFSVYRLVRESESLDPIFQRATDQQRINVASEDLLNLLTGNLRIVRISGGSGFHFRLPSGSHSNYFVRLAEAFRNRELLSRAAYWLAGAMSLGRDSESQPPYGLMIVDNPSMLAVAEMANSIALRPDLEVFCVEEYPQTPLEKIQLAEKLASSIARVRAALFFIGISSSGRLVSSMKESLEKIDKKLVERLDHVTLYSFRDADPRALCKLSFPDFFIARSEGECPACRDGSSSPVAIDPSVYYVSAPKEVEKPLVPALFDAQRGFIVNYGSVEGVLRVHVEDPTDRSPRHHAFYINVGSLLKTESVWVEIDKTLTSLNPKPTAILAPEHPTAASLASHASTLLGVPSFEHKTFRGLEELPTTFQQLIAGLGGRTETILIIDDVIRTGSRMKSINKALREDSVWDKLLDRIAHIHFLGVVSTTESKAKWGEIERGLSRNHPWKAGLGAIFDVPLPNWGAPECPWCNERELLRRLIGPEVFEKSLVSDRMARLENTSGGLTREPFFNAAGLADPTRAAGSAMFPAELTAMQALFLFASAVNQSRQLPDGIDSEAFPGPRLVASRVFRDNYDERMKWKALFRSLKPTEMHENARRDLAKMLAADIKNNQEPHYWGEAFLAALRGLLRDVEAIHLLKIADQLGLTAQYAKEVIEGVRTS